MILHLGYEELSALREGVRLAIGGSGYSEASWGSAGVMVDSRVAALEHRLVGDMGIHTLAEQREMAEAFRVVLGCLRDEMEAAVLAAHPADEVAIASYFGFAHGLAALDRLDRMGRQMEALIEVVSGGNPTEELVREFNFPD